MDEPRKEKRTSLFESINMLYTSVSLHNPTSVGPRMKDLMGPFNDEEGTYGLTQDGRRVPWRGASWNSRWPKFKTRRYRHAFKGFLNRLTNQDKKEAKKMGVKT